MLKLCLLITLGYFSLPACAISLTVNTTYGPVQGVVFSDYPSYIYLSIPYAAPPTGQLRFSDPQPPTPWTKTYDASTFKAGCPQNCELPHPEASCPAVTSEDCLTLSVFVPQIVPITTPLPVMVFFHGGNFIQGAGGVSMYHGSHMATLGNVVVVTVNYRLGVLGGLYTGDVIRGNFMIKDQRLALKWIQSNIAAFGGDQHSVTIFGQSAGAASAAAHLASPRSWGLFHKAIIQSDPLTLPCETTASATNLADIVLGKLNCSLHTDPSHVACLRNKSTQELLAVQQTSNFQPWPWNFFRLFMPWTPVVTTDDELPIQPLQAARSGQLAPEVSIIIGSVHDEAVMFIWRAWKNPTLTYADIQLLLDMLLGANNSAAILKLYGTPPPNTDLRYFLSEIATDYMFYCPIRWYARYANKTRNVYQYRFDDLPSWNTWLVNATDPECVGYICHGSELASEFYPLQVIPQPPPRPPTPQETKLAVTLGVFFTNLAHSGSPNFPSTPPFTWPVVRKGTDVPWLMNFTIPSALSGGDDKDSICNVMDEIGYSH